MRSASQPSRDRRKRSPLRRERLRVDCLASPFASPATARRRSPPHLHRARQQRALGQGRSARVHDPPAGGGGDNESEHRRTAPAPRAHEQRDHREADDQARSRSRRAAVRRTRGPSPRTEGDDRHISAARPTRSRVSTHRPTVSDHQQCRAHDGRSPPLTERRARAARARRRRKRHPRDQEHGRHQERRHRPVGAPDREDRSSPRLVDGCQRQGHRGRGAACES